MVSQYTTPSYVPPQRRADVGKGQLPLPFLGRSGLNEQGCHRPRKGKGQPWWQVVAVFPVSRHPPPTVCRHMLTHPFSAFPAVPQNLHRSVDYIYGIGSAVMSVCSDNVQLPGFIGKLRLDKLVMGIATYVSSDLFGPPVPGLPVQGVMVSQLGRVTTGTVASPAGSAWMCRAVSCDCRSVGIPFMFCILPVVIYGS